MAKQIAVLDYLFLFDPGQLWSSGAEFESSLNRYFNSIGVEARVTPSLGGTGKRVIFLTRKGGVPPVPQPKGGKPATQFLKGARKTQQKRVEKGNVKFPGKGSPTKLKASKLTHQKGRMLSQKIDKL